MTDEPAHNALEEKMVPGLLFSSECAPQLSITKKNSEVAVMLRFQLSSA